MSGIYDEWLDKATGEVVKSFSIIITDPNPLTDYIHNTKHRMPAILSAGDEDSWLDRGLGKKDIVGLLRAFPALSAVSPLSWSFCLGVSQM